MRRARLRGPHRLFFLLVFLPMLCVFPYLRAVNNPNEFVRVFTAMSIVEHSTFNIDEPVTRWGWVNDRNYPAYTHRSASHSQYAAVAFLAFAMSERERRLSGGDAAKTRISRAFLAGFFTSACVTLEYHALFLAIVLSLFALWVFTP